MADPTFWEDAQQAQKKARTASDLKGLIHPFRQMESRVEDLNAILPDAISLRDEEFTKQLLGELNLIAQDVEKMELRQFLSDPLDQNDCYLTINAGAGGTESCDWVDILGRMYSRWATNRGWQVELIDRTEGDSAGSKSLTYQFKGSFAFGYARVESGVHRLVRISPFDANQRRHTSFASVDVTPEIDEAEEVELKSDELRVDTYRASGAGGQHVNKTDSAVRITHLPTNTVVACQSQRSQLQNKESCLKLLKAKLYAQRLAAREQALQDLSSDKRDNAFGSQIRSYVFQPYTLIKDTRTRFEIGNIQAVLDGDLDPFIHAFLRHRANI